MFTLFKKESSKTAKKKELKTLLLKEVFNSGSQKKAVVRAARESAKDQQRVVEKYQDMLKSKAVI